MDKNKNDIKIDIKMMDFFIDIKNDIKMMDNNSNYNIQVTKY